LKYIIKKPKILEAENIRENVFSCLAYNGGDLGGVQGVLHLFDGHLIRQWNEVTTTTASPTWLSGIMQPNNSPDVYIFSFLRYSLQNSSF
jgi:hypothetical protein